MKVRFTCDCGRPVDVAVSQAGKRVMCPHCRRIMLAPENLQAVIDHAIYDPVQQKDDGMVRGRCKCGKIAKAPIQWAGRRVGCPRCGKPVDLPELEDLLGEVIVGTNIGRKKPEVVGDRSIEVPIDELLKGGEPSESDELSDELTDVVDDLNEDPFDS